MSDVLGVPIVPFETVLASFDWQVGEHVALVGPTGCGKTTLALRLIERRKWVAILATKPRDETLNGLARKGWKVIRRWPPPNDTFRHVILWPKWRTKADNAMQRARMAEAIDHIFLAGAWTIFADDVQYLSEHLGLSQDLNTVWLQARALKVSLIAATQRPRKVPVEMWANSTHLFIWKTAQPDDLKALAGLADVDTANMRAIVRSLPKHHFLYINTRKPTDFIIAKVGT